MDFKTIRDCCAMTTVRKHGHSSWRYTVSLCRRRFYKLKKESTYISRLKFSFIYVRAIAKYKQLKS